MDWPPWSDGWDVQSRAWVQSLADVYGWVLLSLAAAVAILLLLTTLIVTRTVRRRFWCDQAQCEVEVEFLEQRLLGFLQLVVVQSCSVFEPPTAVQCRRRCLDCRHPGAVADGVQRAQGGGGSA